MGFFGRLIALVKGIFLQSGDDMVSSSPRAIHATYAAAIDDSKQRYKEMQEAVAMLARERQKTEDALKKLDEEERDLQRKLEGALAAAEAEPGNQAHVDAGTRYLSRMKEIDDKQESLAGELEAQKNKVEEYKSKLRSFYQEIEKLKREQGEMVAEFISNQRMLQLEDQLRGLADTAIDDSIVAIREKVGRMRQEVNIASEMRSTTEGPKDDLYEKMGAEREAANRFDELLKARARAKTGVPEKEREIG